MKLSNTSTLTDISVGADTKADLVTALLVAEIEEAGRARWDWQDMIDECEASESTVRRAVAQGDESGLFTHLPNLLGGDEQIIVKGPRWDSLSGAYLHR